MVSKCTKHRFYQNISATAPTLTATANAKDIFVFYTRDGGTNWYGFTAGQALG